MATDPVRPAAGTDNAVPLPRPRRPLRAGRRGLCAPILMQQQYPAVRARVLLTGR
jgi:hypothetical protein